MSMTETLFTSKSKTVKNSNNSQTLKTVIPSSVRDVLNLSAYDELNWNVKFEDNKFHCYISKKE